MELEAVLNDNYELDYYEVKQKKGTITKHITVNPEMGYFDIARKRIKESNQRLF